MSRETTYNFAAGPSALPQEVLEQAARELVDYHGTGMSVMEMSHRSAVYQEIFNAVKADMKRALHVPDTHEVLFLQGGASLQFSMIPLNLMGEWGNADYAVTGNFAKIAAKEAGKYGRVNIAADTSDCNHTRIPEQSELVLQPDAKYFYYCSNNTIYGTEWHYVPETKGVTLVSDMSSDILTQPLDVSRFGVIFAGAQKNLAPAGLTVVIVRKDLAGNELPSTPLMLSYERMIEKDSMYNTPPCYNIYMLGLMLKWVEKNGGVEGMDALKRERSAILYDYLDESRLFRGCAERDARSFMNVTFTTGDKDLDADFCKAATAAGFLNVKGHRLVGGCRASIYNAQPIPAVKALAEFMKDYEVKHHV
ncbi:MAG: 3-phosphoserine/phosphohydroxythreonine transaminase [Oscillospiraceae bacterium]|nr:3-phosphoserine/phosphohydroxythreonine transaminase [Oscillospiraceae bacterium]MBR3083587.1 3-phosphoserine/phosphohydroxythreonine transaminase [Oscillospiraceae bacterium]MBR3860460.1 3-phosphoserine/phosphohydroxythreonine transaminase [Oscillospiraceae bacterium]MBR6096304.1 3-phosphoserine/phosphohydroxythreonine transaminase [Oscillospiraceae bacterium]MBR7056793.1 3-phosphoserine/phosphohydroxythreonine transaminase [Oscillospiraceae bacterium]